ncbi:metallophosphoesterase family protein [Rhodopirellula sp. P2]|uniref:metallophosphoesterase family protein n=1 Tax=Rhodopirellula sp. P2 TaxID=2127060 RepID=UPI0023682354|nr:metallophosphoesterase [Rhodopirellula sp. P2]WDQ15787.1 metallophosphoesterase [Rhodopirellula sp. P2]
MKRRSFLQSAVAASAVGAVGHSSNANAAPPAEGKSGFRTELNDAFAIDDNAVIFRTDAVTRPVNVMVVADTHLFTDDDRGEPYREFSGRMAKAYNRTTHFKTRQPTTPEKSFQDAIERANAQKVDLLALVGDIFSFPSEAAIEWVSEQLDDLKMPWLYVAGNHDWHYEGMEGSLQDLRSEWIERRLKPLYQGKNPLMAAYDIHGVRFLALDNSNYEVLPEQLEFFREQLRSGLPLVLLVHIPLYVPGRSMGFGCGHPEWGADTDRNHKIERRPKWPESGHTQATFDFHREVFGADPSQLLGVFAGHTHRQSVDVINGIPQFVTNANAVGAFMDVRFVPQA